MHISRGVARNLLRGWRKEGSRVVVAGVGSSGVPGGGLGAKPQKLDCWRQMLLSIYDGET